MNGGIPWYRQFETSKTIREVNRLAPFFVYLKGHGFLHGHEDINHFILPLVKPAHIYEHPPYLRQGLHKIHVL